MDVICLLNLILFQTELLCYKIQTLSYSQGVVFIFTFYCPVFIWSSLCCTSGLFTSIAPGTPLDPVDLIVFLPQIHPAAKVAQNNFFCPFIQIIMVFIVFLPCFLPQIF